ncbi:MAG: SUMF1/EgtB/PvdO family nonheme iron enzyme [Verrucomicrobia bacterium]|nr:SUMF1/EgtB/PvdO family nonheme iron enzyme [Verrucomicrobiota bacterium]
MPSPSLENHCRKGFTLLAVLALALAPAAHAQVTVSNVRAAQRPGTNLVDIDYDVSGTPLPLKVTLQVSADDGSTFGVPATSLSGAVGFPVTPGPNLRLTWDAGTDWGGQFSERVRCMIAADDGPMPEGFALIPAGSFSMGDAHSASGGGYSDELPVHMVQVSAFLMAKYEVTKALWDEVRTWGASHGYPELPPGGGKAATHPVHSINWWAMLQWCNARSQKDGLTPCYYTDAAQTLVFKTGFNNLDDTMVKWSANGYRLPTEAEWEKAARGGLSGKRFPWGDTINHTFANYYSYGNYSYEAPQNQGHHPAYATGDTPYTSPVGSFAGNGYGLYDMAGNLWERCWDWYSSSYYASSPGSNPRGAAEGTYRVVRGGFWDVVAFGCRVSLRDQDLLGYSNYDMGFRPARSYGP